MQVASDTSPSGRCDQHLAELHTSHHPDALDVLNLGQLVQPLRPAPDSEAWDARPVGFQLSGRSCQGAADLRGHFESTAAAARRGGLAAQGWEASRSPRGAGCGTRGRAAPAAWCWPWRSGAAYDSSRYRLVRLNVEEGNAELRDLLAVQRRRGLDEPGQLGCAVLAVGPKRRRRPDPGGARGCAAGGFSLLPGRERRRCGRGGPGLEQELRLGADPGGLPHVSTTNSTAFSPTDTIPLSSRAKALMALESISALVLSVIVIAHGVGSLR